MARKLTARQLLNLVADGKTLWVIDVNDPSFHQVVTYRPRYKGDRFPWVTDGAPFRASSGQVSHKPEVS